MRRTAVIHQSAILHAIFRSGLIVALPADLPLQSIIKVSDALLASPIVAVLVPWHPGIRSLLTDLRRRSGSNFVIGVSGVKTAVQLAQLRYADYVVCERDNAALQRAVQKAGLVYLLETHSLAAVASSDAGAVVVSGAGEYGRLLTRSLLDTPNAPAVIVQGAFSPDDATFYARIGASAMIVHQTIYEDDEQLMADLITRARRMQAAWDAGVSDE